MVRKAMSRPVTALFLLLFAALSVSAQSGPPRVFFTDLISGPDSGGENGNGTILTIYGRNFGATRGSSTVTVGGGAVAAYVVWGGKSAAQSAGAQLETISVAIGSKAATGSVVVNTSSGSSSCEDTRDSCKFTVRSGNIHCVSTSGNDGGAGNFPSSCWKSIAFARSNLAAGDTVYIENGVAQTSVDNYNADLSMTGNGCGASNPCALVAYPGATVTVGTSGAQYGIRTPAVSASMNYWTLAGLHIIGQAGLDLVQVTGWRVINNDFSCPNGSGQSACMHTDTTTQYAFYANYVHDVGSQAGSIDKYYHGVYFTTNSNHIWAGWNEINNNPAGSSTSGGCRAMQFYSTGGSDQFDLHVHDNWIHNSICDGLNFSTVNADNGTVEAYNNVIFHVGTGPDPYNGSSNYSCIVAGGGGSSPVQVYNNTLYDCGGRKTTDSGAFTVDRSISATNNLVEQLSGESFYTSSGGAGSLSGSHNLWYGASTSGLQTTSNLTVNPLLSSPPSAFTLQTASPAISAGSTSKVPAYDFAGNGRGNPPTIGAYDVAGGVVAQKPNPPTNLSVIVN